MFERRCGCQHLPLQHLSPPPYYSPRKVVATSFVDNNLHRFCSLFALTKKAISYLSSFSTNTQDLFLVLFIFTLATFVYNFDAKSIMKFSLLCLSAICASTTTAFVLPTQRLAAVVGSVSSSTTQLNVAAEVVNGETKPRRTRQVRSDVGERLDSSTLFVNCLFL